MLELQNILYVITQGTVLQLDHDTVRITVESETVARVPLVRVAGIVMVGRVSATPFLIQRCAEDGRSMAWLDARGRFKARIEGALRGNVLLRRAQHLALSDPERTLGIARQIVAAKLQNTRQVLLRAARETTVEPDQQALDLAAERIASILMRLPEIPWLDEVRGAEGEGARAYFGVFGHMVRVDREVMAPDGRSRRPPRDRANALLSFLYALLRGECSSALEAAGLDPQVGYLHALRPGRPALALDLMEELRAVIADRLALTLINRRQLDAGAFEGSPGDAVSLTEEGRKQVVRAFQKRKEDKITHRVLGRHVPLGLIPHVQARLLARYLRGDLVEYPPFLYR